MTAALVILASAAAALAGAVAVLSVRLAAVAGRAIDASDARGRADVANTATAADLRIARAELEAARRDLAAQKEVTHALQILAARRPSALDAPGVDPVDLMLALADQADPSGDDPAVRAGDAVGVGGGANRLPRGGRPAPVSDELAGDAEVPR
jgi:hypothetical protein